MSQLVVLLTPAELDAYNVSIRLARQDQNQVQAIWITMLVSCILFCLAAIYLLCKSSKIKTRNFFILTNLLILLGVIAAEEVFRELATLTTECASLQECVAPQCT